MARWATAFHGGAGVDPSLPDHKQEEAKRVLARCLQRGVDMLRSGAPALDVVEAVVRELETDPFFNSGRGSALTRSGTVEMEASIMDKNHVSLARRVKDKWPYSYPTFDGAKAFARDHSPASPLLVVSNSNDPVSLARRVMDKSPHSYLAFDGAEAFAFSDTDMANVIPGETRLDLLQRNVALFRKIVVSNPDAPLLVVSNPVVHVLAHVARKLPGFPFSRFIASGTNLNSSRLRFLLDVNAQDVQDSSRFHVNAYMVGEHCDSSEAVWLSVSVPGMPVLNSLQGSRGLADEIVQVDAATFLTRTSLVSVTRGSDLAIVTAVPAANVALTDGTPTSPHQHRRHRRQRRRWAAGCMTTVWMIVVFALSIASSSSVAAASRLLRTSSSRTAGTRTRTAAFCGSACRADDDLKLQGAFMNEVKTHGYHDAQCRSELKAYFCAVCLAPAPASDPFNSNTTASINNNSSLPLGCAASPSSSGSIHDVTCEPPPTPGYWLPPDDGNQASKAMPDWLIALISIIGMLLCGSVAYTVKVVCCNNCCNGNNFFGRAA